MYGMRLILLMLLVALVSLLNASAFAGDNPTSQEQLAKPGAEYADVLALQGTAKAELLAIARILRANPKLAIDRVAASNEYCFNSGLGTMVHYAVQPEHTTEDVVYEFDASGLIAAGLDPARLEQLPALGQMKPGIWYFLPKGQPDPHHAHEMSSPTVAIGVNVK
jgi:hypothetical protein